MIVAQDARGEGWKRIVGPTKRWADEDDILAVVAKERKGRFIPDAGRSLYDDQEAVELANVISYFVAPLIAPTGEIVGALQVDLGDMSNLGEDGLPIPLRMLLDAFAHQIATGLSLAIQMHEMRLSELFDRAVKASLVEESVEHAAQAFVNIVTAQGRHYMTFCCTFDFSIPANSTLNSSPALDRISGLRSGTDFRLTLTMSARPPRRFNVQNPLG